MDYSIYVCMNLIEACCWFYSSLWIFDYSTFHLVMSFCLCVPFQAACYHSFLRGTLFHPSICQSLSCTFLDSPQLSHPFFQQGHLNFLCTKLWSRKFRMTQYWDSYTIRSEAYWDFLLGRSPYMLAGPALSTQT